MRPRRLLIVALGCVVLLAGVVVMVNRVGGADGFSLAASPRPWAYVAIAALVFGDAVCPVLPGETTLNAGAALAADDTLEIGLVILAGTIGAVTGDSVLYWIARKTKRRVRPEIERIESDQRARAALSYMKGNAPLLIVAGRYVPGLRFVVNATMGVSEYPYRRFLLWSSAGGALWALYTCGLAYVVATALAGFPLASVLISSVVTTTALAIVFLRLRRTEPRIGGV